MSDAVDVGLVSTAHLHANGYAPILSGLDGANFVGIADEDEDRGREAADRYGTSYYERDDLLDEVDAAIVCSTNVDHADHVAACADAGVDVLCEKPLATGRAEATEMVERCADAGVKLGVAMPLRFSPPVRSLANALDDGRLGKVHAINGTNRATMPGGWFADPEAAGGGAVMDHTPHVVDLAHDLVGERVVEVHAEIGTRFHDISVDDVNVLSMELADGTSFVLDGSWSRPDNWPTWGGATLEISGTEGVASVDCFEQNLTYTGDVGDTDVREISYGSDANAGLIQDFVAAVRDGRPPEITGQEGAEVVAVIDAAYRSMDRGEPVTVEY